jgi:hypothetical protein
MARIRGHGSPPAGQQSSPAERSSPPAFRQELNIPSIPDRPRKLFDAPETAAKREARLFETRESRTLEASQFGQFEQPDLRSRTSPGNAPEASGMPDFLKLQQENVRLKAELLKTRKRLQAAEEEIKKLQMAIEKSEILRKRANQQLAAVRESG